MPSLKALLLPAERHMVGHDQKIQAAGSHQCPMPSAAAVNWSSNFVVEGH
jgi:hypothetical protein